jgi:hypothetical protein
MIRAFNAIAFIVAAALAVALYIAKTEVQGEKERLTSLQTQLAEERRQINVLNVEIAHLEDPERLRALARRYLGFEPLDPSHEVTLADLPHLVESDTGGDRTRREMLIVSQVDDDAVVAEPGQAGGAD